MKLLDAYIAVLLCIVAVKAERCTPGIVQTIVLDSNNRLNWTNATNPNNCIIIGYVINVFDHDGKTQLQLTTSANVLSYDLSILGLDMCSTYFFEVHALTNEFVLGSSNRVSGTTAPSGDMNLSLTLSYYTDNNFTEVDILWNVTNSSFANCVSYYRVIYWDLSNNPKDLYVPSRNVTVGNLLSCMTYSFQVNAIVSNPNLEGPINEFNLTTPGSVPDIPRLINMTTNSTAVRMFWQLPTYAENRCQLTSLVVNTIGAPPNKAIITVPIQDSPLRSDIQVTIDGLSPNNVYVSYVALRNSYGASKNITVSYQTSSDRFLLTAM